MNPKSAILHFFLAIFIIIPSSIIAQHEIVFCGERIPVDNNFVADKLMNVIRRQIPNVNLPDLRHRAKKNFPLVEYYLRETGLPEDLKYVAIVESGFKNLTSIAGARGFWQLMPETARELGLVVTPDLDERDDILLATNAACKVLADYYLMIRKKYGISSWVLTAAAYNFGIGNIFKAINRQGKDYFSMQLNPETAVYVYRIIAVKELFEYPELYMKNFGYNVFNAKAPKLTAAAGSADTAAFTAMEVKVSENDGHHPDQLNQKQQTTPPDLSVAAAEKNKLETRHFKYLSASIKGKYKKFEDGELVAIELLENMEFKGSFNRKGNQLKGKGWIIGDRVFIDLGYNSHDVTLLDLSGEKGIPLDALKNKAPVLLKVIK